VTRLGGCLVALAAVIALRGEAQVPELPTITESWNEVSYPKILWSPRNGFSIGLYYGQVEPMGYDDFNAPQRYHGAISVDGQISSSGRKDLAVEGRFPKLVEGWRFYALFNAYRHPRDLYFGVGNETTYSRDSITPAREEFYDADRRTTRFRGEVQRTVVGPLRALAGFNVQRWRIELPDGPSVLGRDHAAGLVPTVGTSVDDVHFRVGVVLDTRDDEVAPRRGFVLEAIHGVADSSFMGSASYTRTTGVAAGYVPVGDRTVVAARVVGQRMGGDPPFASWYLIEASDDPYEGLGGENSHRAFANLRFAGRHKLFGNLDVRYDVLRIESLLQVSLVGFVDAGRVFEGEDFRITGDGMHVGGGAGLFLRWGRTGVIGATGGIGADGLVFHVNTRWAY
jgi:hypothetical protein